jgi:hypothetical protein
MREFHPLSSVMKNAPKEKIGKKKGDRQARGKSLTIRLEGESHVTVLDLKCLETQFRTEDGVVQAVGYCVLLFFYLLDFVFLFHSKGGDAYCSEF